MIPVQAFLQDLEGNQVHQQEIRHGVLDYVSVQPGHHRSGADHGFHPVQMPVCVRQVPVQLRDPQFAHPVQRAYQGNTVIHPSYFMLAPVAAVFVEKGIESEQDNRENSKMSPEQRHCKNGKDEKHSQQQIHRKPERGGVLRPEERAQVHTPLPADPAQEQLNPLPDLRPLLRQVDQSFQFPGRFPVCRPAEHVIQILFPGCALAGIDPPENLIQVQVIPGRFIHIERIPVVCPAAVVIGADPVHVPRIVFAVRLLPVSFSQFADQLLFFPWHHHVWISSGIEILFFA